MLMIVEAWCKSEDEGGLGLPIEDLASAINRSPKTLKSDYVSVLRKQGRLPQARQGNRSELRCRASGTSVENSTEKISTVHTTRDSNEVNRIELQAVEELRESHADMVAALEQVVAEQAAEIQSLKRKLSTLENDSISTQQLQQQRGLEHTSGLSPIQVQEGPEHDPYDLPPIDYDWHPGIQVGTKEREDANRIGRLLDEIGRIQVEYAFTGIWGPHEWESILAGCNRLAACAAAQRRFRPGSQSGPVIDIG